MQHAASVAVLATGANGDSAPAPRDSRIRWRVFGLLFLLTVAAYVQRTSVSVAGARMMPDLGLSQVQLGWLETAFLVSYTALQFPGAVVGQRLGARRMFTVCGLLGVAAALAMPTAPAVLAGLPLFLALLAAQFTLGVSQAPFFAVLTGAFERWFPPRDWALTQGLNAAGMGLGAAVAPAVIASLMVATGWRGALWLTGLPVLLLVAAWWRWGRDAPHLHPDVSATELAKIAAGPAGTAPGFIDALRLLANRDLALLTVGYLAMNVVFYLITFWSFLYLVQARHFSLLGGGFAATLPPLAGAIGGALGGMLVGACAARFGARRGLRLTPLVTLPASGLLLLIAVHVGEAWLALGALALAFGVLEMNEAAFWTTAMEIGRLEAAAACGVLNTGGNLGGIIATPIVAYVSARAGWDAPFQIGAAAAVVAALVWLFIDPTRSRARPAPAD